MFDTLRYSKFLESVGVSRDQAEAHIKILAEVVETQLATKQDIKELRQELKHEMALLEQRLVIKLGALMGTMITFAIAVTAAITKLL